jgi:hypothetical protein
VGSPIHQNINDGMTKTIVPGGEDLHFSLRTESLSGAVNLTVAMIRRFSVAKEEEGLPERNLTESYDKTLPSSSPISLRLFLINQFRYSFVWYCTTVSIARLYSFEF